MSLLTLERISRLGRLGEDLVAERLQHHGYTNVENLNLLRHNYPFGDLPATKNGVRYFIGVKTRNESRQGNVGLNEFLQSRVDTRRSQQAFKGPRQNHRPNYSYASRGGIQARYRS